MAFWGYCFKFYLNAMHSVLIDGINSPAHSHRWEISLYISQNTKEFFRFTETEIFIEKRLSNYQSKYLNNMPPFDTINPTLENIGDFLFSEFKDALSNSLCTLVRMEISETPVRTYVITGNNIDDDFNKIEQEVTSSLLIKNILENVSENFKTGTDSEDTSDIIDNTGVKENAQYINSNDENFNDEEYIAISEAINMKPYKITFEKIFGAISLIALFAVFLIFYVNRKGSYPWGSDTFGHIFKADLLYNSISKGNFYPRYTELWYNGIQPFRYWAPVPYYILAFFEFLTKGDTMKAYNIFIVFSFTAGAFGWLLWGVKEKRILVGVISGILWFIMPDNIRVFFSEGNIPRATIAILLPYIFYFAWQFVEYGKKYALIVTMLFMTAAVFCHVMIAAMIGITFFIFLMYYGIINKKLGPSMQMILGMLISFGICGFWLYPALQGGILSLDSEAVSEVMKSLTFPFTQSLNPMLRYNNIEIFYFSISVFVTALSGIFLSSRKSIPGFLTVLTIFLGTTTALVPILIKLPFNQLLWMMRFTPIVYGVFIVSIFMWKSIKRYALSIILIFVILDSAASFKLLAFNTSPSPLILETVDEAAKIASQRVAIMDCSEFGSFPSYYLCTGENTVPYAYGWAWQGAATAQNIVMLNTAIENEYYSYMFDRCLEMGCDTVVIKRDKVKDFNKLNSCANRSGYNLIKELYLSYIYKVDTPKKFGMTVKYSGLAIGKSASNISLDFPDFEIGRSIIIEDYTLDELMQYKVIYLSGFEYKNKSSAEALLLEASKKGVKVVVDMNRIPNDPLTNRLTFLDVTAQPIQFENKLPDLFYINRTYFPTTFKEEYKKWNTVYLENVKKPLGFSYFGGNKLVFIGTSKNDTITYIGFNLLYHGIVDKDEGIKEIFETSMGLMKDSLPDRKIVEINVEYDNDTIRINAPIKDINTTLASLDAFETDTDTYTKHNLLFLKEDAATIRVTLPYLKEGIIVSVTALISAALLIIFVFWRKKEL